MTRFRRSSRRPALVARAAPDGPESGATLLELTLVIALLAIFAGTAVESLAQRPAQARTAAIAFAGLVAQARALAAITGDADLDGSSGATIGVVRDGDTTVATLYAYRPVRGANRAPTRRPGDAPLRIDASIALGPLRPPFALFFSASGHAAAQAAFTVGSSAPLPAEPACPPDAGIALTFGDGARAQTYALSCELAQLDVDRPPAAAAAP